MSEFSRRGPWRFAVAICVGLALWGCSDEPETEDTAAEVEYEGVSSEEMQSEVEAMSLEEAERLGIIDTTIQIVPPMDPDSVEALDQPIIPIDTAQP